LKISKFEAGQSQPSSIIAPDLALLKRPDLNPYSYKALPSAEDRNVVYFAMFNKNPEKEAQLSLVKADFNSNTSNVVYEVLSKDHLKQITKGFIPPSKDIETADYGNNWFDFRISTIPFMISPVPGT
jgi:hypothetical protein